MTPREAGGLFTVIAVGMVAVALMVIVALVLVYGIKGTALAIECFGRHWNGRRVKP